MQQKPIPTDEVGGTATTTLTVPDKKYAPKPIAKPAYVPETVNLADKEETVKKTSAAIKAFYQKFKVHTGREAFEKEMDISDEMWRCAKTRTALKSDQSAEIEDTR